MPKLLVITSTYPAAFGDGTPAFVRDLAIEESKEFETLVLAPRVPGSAPLERDTGVLVRRYGYFPCKWESLADGAIIENLRAKPATWLQVPSFFWNQFHAIRQAIDRFQPDVIHAHWIIPQGLVASVASRKIPILVSTLGGDLYALNSPPLRFAKRMVLNRAKMVTVMNRDMCQRIQNMNVPSSKIRILPMGTNLSRSRAPRSAGQQKRPDKNILFVGRLVEKKGLAVLFAALRLLDDTTRSNCMVTVVGDGPLRPKLEVDASADNLPVRFVGQQGRMELTSLYADADIMVVPSVVAASGDQDGLPVALLEAMSSGCAAVASDLPGINEVIEDGVNGLLVESGNAQALQLGLRRLVSDSELRTSLGESAAIRAADFTLEAIGTKFRVLLREVLAGS